MKHFGLCILTLGLASSAFGSACVQGGTFSSYITAGSCTFVANGQTYTLDDFTFLSVKVLTGEDASSFTLSESTTAPTVTITPLAAAKITGIGSETLLLGFDITANTPSIGFTNVNLAEQSSLTGISTGTVAEEDCFGGLLPVPGSINVASLGNGGLACLNGGLSVGATVGLSPGVNANANVNIPINGPFTNSVDVLKEISLTAIGSASVSSITQSFATTTNVTGAPEPGSMFLGGCGLLGVALALRRRQRVQTPDTSSK